ncbi:MAG: hypothetical protein AB9880_01730 [Christensenellales bacterium]
MKKLLSVFTLLVLLSLLISADGGSLNDLVVNPPGLAAIIPRPTNTTKVLDPKDILPIQPNDVPAITSPPVSDRGLYVTSEGPLFLSFRADLTDKLYMFTPMDLSQDGEYHFPLVGSSEQVVGDTRVAVQNSMVIVTFLVVNGVSVDEEESFFTFFPDTRSVSSVEPTELQSTGLRFGIPYNVTSWLKSDSRVLLYINCPASYKTNLNGLTPFSFTDSSYINRIMELIPLMD